MLSTHCIWPSLQNPRKWTNWVYFSKKLQIICFECYTFRFDPTTRTMDNEIEWTFIRLSTARFIHLIKSLYFVYLAVQRARACHCCRENNNSLPGYKNVPIKYDDCGDFALPVQMKKHHVHVFTLLVKNRPFNSK